MENFYFFITFLIFYLTNISSANVRFDYLGYENLQFSTFINDCNYDTQRCNLTVYQNIIMYRSIKSLTFLDGFDVLVPSQNGYQFADVFLDELNKESALYDFGQTCRLAVQGPYFYHCVVPEFHRDFVANCLTIDIFSSFYYYYTRDIKNQVYVGLIFTNSSVWGDSNSTCLVKHINETLLNYENIISIVGYNDSILICGNHQLNNSLIVYSYNFTNEKQSFVFADKINITHVIQPIILQNIQNQTLNQLKTILNLIIMPIMKIILQHSLYHFQS
ncbi:hypothetical protein ACTFIR_007587 [Dictyostelium discoideum]